MDCPKVTIIIYLKRKSTFYLPQDDCRYCNGSTCQTTWDPTLESNLSPTVFKLADNPIGCFSLRHVLPMVHLFFSLRDLYLSRPPSNLATNVQLANP